MSVFEDSITASINDLRRRVADLETLDRPLTSTFALKTTTITTGVGLTGGGDLSANRTVSMGTPSALSAATTNSATGVTHTHSVTTSNTAAVSTIVATDASGEVLVKAKSGSILRSGSSIEAGVTFGAVTLPVTAVFSHPGWTNATLVPANLWVNFGAPFANASYYKDQSGRVYIRGLVKNGTINTTIFTLPAGYIPAFQHIFTVYSSSGPVRLDVNAAGGVLTAGAPAGAYTYLSLECSFQTQ